VTNDNQRPAQAFGERIRGLRTEKGLSEGELAEKCGVPPSTITRTEIGSKEPQLSLILRLCASLSTPPGILLDGILSAEQPHTAESHFEAKIAALTPREKEVLEGLTRAETNGEIAYGLSIGVETVRTHVARILHKLGVQSRRALFGVSIPHPRQRHRLNQQRPAGATAPPRSGSTNQATQQP
jgi:DNA-binding CsgD family transcriptional regulator/DNA-binding Xre family transcriptional regulator